MLQSLLHLDLSCRKASAMSVLCSSEGCAAESCYLLSDGAGFYFVVKQFAASPQPSFVSHNSLNGFVLLCSITQPNRSTLIDFFYSRQDATSWFPLRQVHYRALRHFCYLVWGCHLSVVLQKDDDYCLKSQFTAHH